jgi:hypothetical protein
MAVAYASNLFTVSPNTSTVGTGTITASATTVTINSVVYTATQVNGVGTSFTTQLVPGSLISLAGFTNMIVFRIVNNTSLIALKQDYVTNAQVIGTATAFTFRAPTQWTDLVASVTATALPAVASTDGRLNIAFTAASVTVQNDAVLVCQDNVNMSFGNASGYRFNINSAGSLILRNGGHITYNGNVGFSFFAGTVDCWAGRFTYHANQTVASGRQDFFDPATMNSHFISAMDIVVSGGTSGSIQYIHLERLGGKVSELKMFNELSRASTTVLIQFDVGTYPNISFPSGTSTLGFTSDMRVYLARSGGTSTLVKPIFPGTSYLISNPGNTGTAYIIDEIWPDNGGAVGTLTYGGGGTTFFRQFTWYPGTYYTESGWNVYLRDNQGTPVVVQSGVVTASTGLLMTWRRQTASTTNYYPFKLTARKAGYIGKYETFTPVAPRTESFLPVVDTTYTSNQAGLTGISGNNSTNTITSSSSMTLDQRYDWFQYWMALTPQMVAYGGVARVDSVDGQNWTLPTGWTDSVTAGTLSAGTKLTYEYAPTFTLSGTGVITALYASNAGASTTFQFQGVTTGTSLVIYDASGVTKYFQQEVTTAGTYSYYIPPGTAGTYTWAIEKYGTKRESGSFAANTGGLLFYVPAYAEDVGITQATKATVAGYTTLETNSKVYDYIAYSRLSEQFIKLGQILTRSGTSLEWIPGYNVKVKATNATVFSLTSTTFFIKASSLAGDTKYATHVLVPPATLTADTTEVITTEIEDGNGDSSVTIQAAGVSTFEIWKITDATNPDNYATGTLLATVGIGKYRFLSANGFKFVIRDTITNYRVVVEAEKGIYKAELFFGASVQLAQSAEVSQINTKVDIMQIDLEAIKGTGHVKDKHSLTNIKKKAALAAALSA